MRRFDSCRGYQIPKQRRGRNTRRWEPAFRAHAVSWYLDENLRQGRWPVRYLYRAIDRGGNLLDSMLSDHRDRQPVRLRCQDITNRGA
ncbi:MAG: DDE-type integrase/transposase/recombinase [Dehalococcoidia bacterium]